MCDSNQDLERAIREFQAALRINPTNASAHYDLGVAYRKLGQWDKAIADLTKAIELNPKRT